MATLDRESDSVVLRIVYDGPPHAGKTTSLKTLSERLGQGELCTPEETAGRTVYFDWLEYRGGQFEGRPIRCQIVSVPGQRVLAPRRKLLLESADAVVFVADTTHRGLPESTAHLEELLRVLHARPAPRVGVVLQANKRDLPDAGPVEHLRRLHGLAIVESVASAGDGIREAFVFAVRLALDRAREQLRAGELPLLEEGAASATSLLAEMKGVPIDPGAFESWTTDFPAVSEPGSSPRVPDPTVPAGCIWPPIDGRVLLQEACASLTDAPRELTPGEWATDANGGWRFHSSSSCFFEDAETARAALIRWAQQHVKLSEWISPGRCIAVCATGTGGYRVWQVVRGEPSIWKRLTQTLSARSPEEITAHFSEAATLCARAALRWAEAPYELPCTLETVGAVDGVACFLGLMPEADRLSPPEPIDRRVRLWQQLHKLLNAKAGDGRSVR